MINMVIEFVYFGITAGVLVGSYRKGMGICKSVATAILWPTEIGFKLSDMNK